MRGNAHENGGFDDAAVPSLSPFSEVCVFTLQVCIPNFFVASAIEAMDLKPLPWHKCAAFWLTWYGTIFVFTDAVVQSVVLFS